MRQGKGSFADVAIRYAEQVIAGDIVSCWQIKSSCQRFLDDTKGDTWTLNAAKVQRVCQFAETFPYSSSVLAVTPGKTIATFISSTQTWFGSATTVEANAGSNAPVGGSGAGGGSGYGDITFYGGNGASTTQNSAGGGGGGSAGPSGNGWNATIGGGGGSNGGSGSGASGANGGSGSLGEGPTLPNAIAINGAGGSRSATGVQSGDGSTQRLWKSTAGEWAGPGGGGAAGNFSSAGNGGNYGGGGGGGGGAGGETYTAGLGGEGLIVLTYTIAQPGFSHSYWL